MSMHSAFSTILQKSINILDFNKFPENEIERFRRALLCEICKGQAWYTKRSRNGREACFKAHHTEDCAESSLLKVIKTDNDLTREVQQVIANDDEINIDFTISNSGTGFSGNGTFNSDNGENGGVTNIHVLQPARERNVSRRPSKLLKWLLNTDDLAHSDKSFKVGKYKYLASNLFVSFDDISEKHLSNYNGEKYKFRGFFGMMSHVDKQINWLNIANEKDVSIPISKIRQSILSKYKIKRDSDLEGTYVLVFGGLKISNNDNKKWYIEIFDNNLAYITLLLNE